ncbi:MAG: TonB-dependent receptor [Chlorobium sp.]|nr:MAG: TonB-dependent receptor [Chlorobium sp.]
MVLNNGFIQSFQSRYTPVTHPQRIAKYISQVTLLSLFTIKKTDMKLTVKMLKTVAPISLFLALSGNGQALAANIIIEGRVFDKETRDPLPAATVVVQGTTQGAVTDADGKFRLVVSDEGSLNFKASYISYRPESLTAQVTTKKHNYLEFQLSQENVLASQIVVLADRAKERETPVAVSTISKQQIKSQLGSQDIPLVLNTTPSVYSTMQGGGAGDARINVRGFDQRHMGIMINGIPINDMENGWVYWSNWDGLGDITSSIQMQRGLSAVNLAVPAIGGTMNIITDPTAMESGVSLKQEFGNDNFLKTTLVANSGLIDGKYAVTGAVVRKTGDGAVDHAWTDASAYYLGAAWNINKNNRLEFYAMGAPQSHGQNNNKENIAVYDSQYAKSLDGYSPAALASYQERGRTYNQNWSPVSSSYQGQQYWNGSTHDRYDANYINQAQNYYHKPLVNLNWYSQLSESVNLLSTVYYSGGTGGGSGILGTIKQFNANNVSGTSTPLPWRYDWDATVAANKAQADGRSLGILRNSVNNQWTIGALSKLNYQASENLKLSTGIDARKAEIEHFQEVRDLLGGTYYNDTYNQFQTTSKKGLGDKIAYYNTNNVDWLGTYGQAEYKSGAFTGYGTAGISTIKYQFTDHFTKDANGNERVITADPVTGYQFKGGVNYNVTSEINLFTNIGYVAKVPIFDNVIDDVTGRLVNDPKNEKFTSYEAGAVYTSPDKDLKLQGNVYYTQWKDQAQTVNVTNADGTDGQVFLNGLNSRYYGLELEAAWQPAKFVKIDAATSFGNWMYTNDVNGTYNDKPGHVIPYTYYINGLKVGDAPQTQFVLAGTVYPVSKLSVQLVWKYYRDHYSAWDPFTRTALENGARPQSWKIPDYSVFDLHASYRLPLEIKKAEIRLFAHVFNLFNTVYVQEAVDNASYAKFDLNHSADDAGVFLGLSRSWNAGVEVTF